jgi:hypothetical protein
MMGPFMRRPEVGILTFAMLLSACTIPTDSPNWDMTWNLPVPDNNAMSIGVASFLPNGVTAVGSPPTAFSATIASPPAITRTLGADCTSCVPLNGTTAPKPAFIATPPATSTNLAAAASLTSGTLAAGSQIVFSVTNGYNFDPIRPDSGSAATNTGTLTLTVNNGAATLGILTVLGTTSSIPGNGTVTPFTLPLAGAVSGASPITVTMTMTSPAGKNVPINTAQIFSVAATPTINISSATVSIATQAVNAPATPIDMSQIDSTIIKRIQNDAQTRGTMFLTITNPFTVGGAMNVTFSSPAGTPAAQTITPITKAVTLTAAANGTTPNVSTVQINFTGIELRKILGHSLQAAFGGTTAAGSLTVTPALKVGVSSRLQLNFTVKEQ